MNTKKRVFSLILAFIMTFSSVQVFAASEASINHQIHVEKNSPITIDDANSIKIMMESDFTISDYFTVSLKNSKLIDKNGDYIWRKANKYTQGSYKSLLVENGASKEIAYFRTEIIDAKSTNKFVDFEVYTQSEYQAELRFLGAHDGSISLGTTSDTRFETLKNKEGFNYPLISYAEEGDLSVSITGGLSISSFNSADRSEEIQELLKEKSTINKMIAEIQDVKNLSKIVAGKHFADESYINSQIKANQIVYELEAKDNLDFELPKGVKVVAIKMKIENSLNSQSSALELTIDPKDKNELEEMSDYLETDIGTLSLALFDRDDYSVIMLNGMRTRKDRNAKITLDLYLSADINFKGAVELIANLGSEVLKTKVATIESPVTVDFDKTLIDSKQKDFEKKHVTIADNGNIKSGETLELKLSLDNLASFLEVPKIEIAKGNVLISSSKIEEGSLVLKLFKNSNEDFEIVLKDFKIKSINSDKNINLLLSGNAIVNNAKGQTYAGVFASDKMLVNDFLEFSASKYSVEIKFVDGKASTAKITDGDIVKELALDAYIDSKANRTMIGLRQIAYILGIAEDDVSWDKESRTASILRADGKIVSLVSKLEGEDRNIYIDGKIYKEMDIAAQIINNRIYLPISAIADILDVEYNWDQTSKTLVFYH